MKKLKLISKSAFGVLIVLVFWDYIVSRPNFGGVGKCNQMIGFDWLSEQNAEEKNEFPWGFSALTRFAFFVENDFVERSQQELFRYGFSRWREGNFEFSGTMIGTKGSSKWSRRGNIFLIYDQKEGVMHAVRIPR